MSQTTIEDLNDQFDAKQEECINYPKAKTCAACKEEKPVEDFLHILWSYDQRHSYCNDCYVKIYPETTPVPFKFDFRWKIAEQDCTPNTEDFWVRYFKDDMPDLLEKMKVAFSVKTPISINDTADVFQRLVNILADHGMFSYAGLKNDLVEVALIGENTFNRFFEIIGMREAYVLGCSKFTDFLQENAVVEVRNFISPVDEEVLEEDDEGLLINSASDYRIYIINIPKVSFLEFIDYIVEYFRE